MLVEEIKVLEAARNLVAIGWSQKAYARDSKNTQVDVFSSSAVCFCASGAIIRARRDAGDKRQRNYISRTVAHDAIRKGTSGDIFVWNDHPERTQDEVIDLFDKTIAGLKNEIQ